jgi:hypothetical protein
MSNVVMVMMVMMVMIVTAISVIAKTRSRQHNVKKTIARRFL